MDNLLGTTIGNYQVVEKLGRGGMANVYKAYHPGLAVHRALKVVRPEMAHVPGFSERFQLEARAVAGLRHPNIVQVHDFGQQDNLFYMVMELVEGESLRDRIQRLGPIRPFAEALRIVEELAAGLGYAHSRGILHRDVKPENILLSTEGQAILADFGIAKMLESTDAKLTATGIGIGTPAYMAPELARGSTELSPASDLYAAGVVLYETLTARSPFSADTPLAVLHKVIHDPVPPPREFTADIPDALQGVVLKAMAKEPAMRYPNADAFIEACHQSLLGLGPEATAPMPPPVPPPPQADPTYNHGPTTAVGTAVAGNAIAPTLAAGSAADTRHAKRTRNLLLAAAAVLLLFLALGSAAILGVQRYFSARDRSATVAMPAPEPGSASAGTPAGAGGGSDSDDSTVALSSTVALGSAANPLATGDVAESAVEALPSAAGSVEGYSQTPEAAQDMPTATPLTAAAAAAESAKPDTSTSRPIASLESEPRARQTEPRGGRPAAPSFPDPMPEPVGPRVDAILDLDIPVVGEVEAGSVARFEIEFRRPMRVVFDIVIANRRGIYTFTDPSGDEIFQQLGNDFGPFQIENAGVYQLTVETEAEIPLVFELQFRRVGW